MFFRRMKEKARNKGYREGYRQATRDSIMMSGDPDSQQQLDVLEGRWALADARRSGKDV